MSQSIPIPIHVVGHNNPASASASSSSGHATGVAEALSPPQQRRRTKRWVVVDFDGTCTTQDTTPLLPRLASLVDSHQQHILRSQTTTTTTTSNATNSTTTTVSMVETAVAEWQERRPVFKELEDEYFNTFVATSVESHPTSREVRFLQLMERLEVSLDRLDVVSTQITEMVTESSVLRGLGSVTHHELLEAMQLHDDEHEHEHERDKRLSESLRLHPGCLSVLKQCASREHHSIGVLSINWCPALIRAVLLHPLCEPGHDDDDDDDDGQHDDKKRRLLPAPEDIPVWSNTVDRHGAVSLPIPGAVAKKERIIRLQTQTQTQTTTTTATTTATTQEERATVVYVGDSSTDLLALIQADVGILIGRSESTLAMAARFGVTLRPLTEFSHDKNKNNNNNNNYRTSDDMHMDIDADAVVWSAADWGEIGSFLDEF
eukprot:jgi/Psemu1/204056/e_gw1.338.15.1